MAAAVPPPQPLCPARPGGSGGQGGSLMGGESLPNRRCPPAAGTARPPHGASGRAPRGSFPHARGQRPRRTPVTAASSPLFTSVFSTLITRFIAFARGKPGDGDAGEDPPLQPPHCPGEGDMELSRACLHKHLAPAGFGAARGRAEPPGGAGGRCPTARPRGAASACCTNATSSSGGGKK